MELLFCGTGWLPVVDAIRARLPEGVTIRARDPSRLLVEQLGNAQVVLPSNARIDAALLGSASNVLLLQQPAAGYDAIDLAAARALGIPVCNAPGANGDSVAECALLLILELARRAPLAREAFSQGRIGAPLGRELCGKNLGLVGAGGSGGRLRAIAEAMGMTVRVVRSKSTRQDLLALLAASDVVSIHCPLSPSTLNLIDTEALAAMRPGALLVNCARGPIVDRTALEAALASGHLGGVGLDVFWEEPWDNNDPLFARPNVVTLPHVAGSTEESFARIADIVAENVRRLSAHEPLLHRVA